MRLLRICRLEMFTQDHWVKLKIGLVLEPNIDVTEEQDRSWGVQRSQGCAEPKTGQEHGQAHRSKAIESRSIPSAAQDKEVLGAMQASVHLFLDPEVLH